MRLVEPTSVARPEPIRFASQLWQELALRDDWVAQPKFDGWRCVVERDTEVKLWSRHGKAINAGELGLAGLEQELEHLPEGTVLDAEIVRGKGLFVFDMLYCSGVDMRSWPLEKRLYRMAEIVRHRKGVMPILGNTGQKGKLYELSLRGGHEGVVLKCLTAPYPPIDGAKWLKVKP